MFQFIKVRLDIKKKLRQWREVNAHNQTFLIHPLLYPSCVSVGNGTYGPVNVEMSRPDYFLKIGNYCSIANNVTFILSSDHPTNHISTYPFKVICTHEAEYESLSKGDITIDDDVWIGFGATILSGVHIGQGAVIAAGAVVTKDVEPYSIVAGVPANVIKYRFNEDLRKALMAIDYSKLDPQMIHDHMDQLYEPLESPNQLEWFPQK